MGIEAAYAAGIDCIAVPDMKYPGEEYARKARWIAGDLFEAMEIIESMHEEF
jgi:beta-phosphoglucomutase-like phosphatase (HAD superfamily)